jgi:hypothetical protein
MKKQKVPVSVAALKARINRNLKKSGEILKASRSAAAVQECGEFYVVNNANLMVQSDVDLEGLGRKLGVLKPYEAIS